MAQSTLSPPRQDSASPTGVSYRNGTWSASETDLSVGGGLPTGLSLARNYNSGIIGIGPGADWSFSVDGYVSIEALPVNPDFEQPQPGGEPYIYNVVFGGKTVGFVGGSTLNSPPGTHTGGPVGTYQSALPSGAQLVFNGTNGSTGNYVFTDSDGTVLNFTQGPSGRVANWTMPDGTRLDYTYGAGSTLKYIASSRGWALLFESATKICAVNLARSYVTSSSTCPTDAQTVTYGTTTGYYNTGTQLLTSVTRAGQTATYGYNARDHLNCIKSPGQSVCRMQTAYTECAEDPHVSGKQFELHLHDYVVSQTDATGKTYAYTYSNPGSGYPVNCPKQQLDTDNDYRPFTYSTSTMTENGSVTTNVYLDRSGAPTSIVDPLNRGTSFVLNGASGPMGDYVMDTTINGVISAEGNREDYLFDSRGNVTQKTVKAKPNSGLADRVTAAAYPSTCTAIKTCNKPTSVTDARGGVTDYTYSDVHGGMLTESGPADGGGVRPVKRFGYVQRYAWIANGSGGYVHAASAIWLLATEKTCRTTATNVASDSCGGGAADEVVTAYDYGPDTGSVGNNLLLRGVAVTADGATLRTCYGYDANGNRIWETKPRAGLAACY